MTHQFTSIGAAAAALCDDVAASRASRLAELERVLLTNPNIPARREAEAEYLKLTEPRKGED